MRVINLTPEELQLVRDYQINFHFTVQMPKTPKFASRQDEKDYQPEPGVHTCHVTDIATKEVYIVATGADQDTARQAAFALVPVTPKPIPKAQAKIAMNLSGIDPKDAEIAALKAQLAAKGAPVVPPKRKGGRPRKHPLPEVVAPA